MEDIKGNHSHKVQEMLPLIIIKITMRFPARLRLGRKDLKEKCKINSKLSRLSVIKMQEWRGIIERKDQ